MNISLRAKSFLLIITILIIHGIFSVHTAYADDVLEPIRVDTTLDASQTYDIEGSVYVFPGATLTIPAGTQLLFAANAELVVNGNLVVKGTTAHHVVFKYGEPGPYIPLAAPLSVPIDSTQTPDTDNTQSPDTTDIAPVVTNTVMMSADASAAQYHYGIRFDTGSTGTISYADMRDGIYGFTIDGGSTVTASHVAFSDCTTGILGVRGTLHLMSSSFTDVQYPADWDFHGSFTHSGSTFSNTGIKGWRYGGDILTGETMKLNSTDGDYTIPSVTVPKDGSLVISAGVTVFFADETGQGLTVQGTLTASGTTDKPITFYGDGVCTAHTPIITFDQTTSATIGHANFNNLCGGITASHSTVTLTNDTFNTIAATAITGNDYAIIHASDITMHDIYQALNVGVESKVTLSNTAITLVNGTDPAIAITGQTPLSGNTISVTTASTCLGVSDNSSITVASLTLSHCSIAGIVSTNTGSPTGITMTDSEISDSGTAMQLDNAILTNVSNDKFDGNTIGVSLKDMPATTIINNWWGSNSGPTIDSNPDGTGDSIVTNTVVSVTYRPWIGMTAEPQRNPIIIVPGITGSILDKQYGDKSEIWPAIATLALSPTDSFLNDLELQADGSEDPSRPMAVGDIIRSAPGTDVFDGLIAALLQSGYREGIDLFVMPYDWRLSNTTNQSLLKATIAHALQTSGKTKVNIIAHSMGGLLVKDYLAKNSTAPIDHLFFIASPNLGAPKAFKALMYGDDMGFNFSVTPSINIHVLNPDRIKIITQNMPSVYELLPSKKYIDAIGSYVSQGTYLSSDQTLSLLKSSGRNANLFPLATTLHDDTDNLDLSRYITYNFIGCGATKTIGKIFLTKKEVLTATGMQLTDSYRLGYVAGDGTVPRDSAKDISGATNYFTNAGSHGTLPSTNPVKTAIVDILQGVTPDTSGTSLTSSPTCALSGDVVEIPSTVTLDIYDTQGNHTGPTANGDIEFGIPNVDYETIGDEKFAFLPTGPTYTIVNHAVAAGSYDMYISHSAADDTVTSETYFHNVPIIATSIGTVTIKPDDTSYTINLDTDGDDTADTTIAPSSTLNTIEAEDMIPPVTTAAYSNGHVTLSATDDTAGVLITNYSLDGTTWNTYKDPFAVDQGDTVQYFSTDKAGNEEVIKQLVIPVQAITNNTQTPETTPSVITTPNTTTTDTPTENNNYYYEGNTVTTPSSTQTDSDDNSQADTTDQPTDTTPQDNSSDTPSTPANAIDPQYTPATAPDNSVLNTPQATQDTAITEKGISGGIALAKKLLVPAQLVASAANAAPTGNILFYIVIGLCCVIYIIFLRKRYSKKNNQDHSE